MYKSQSFGLLATGTAVSLFAFSSQAAPLQIDFSSDAGTQAGWEALGGTADGSSKNGTYSGYTDLAVGNITVTLTGLEFNRGYNNGTGAGTDFVGTDLDALYSDLLFRNDNGATVNVTIAGLKAGTYEITTHHLIATPNPGDFDLNVQDADSPAFGQSVGNFVQGTGVGGGSGSFNPNVITFEVESNGMDNIVLQMVQGTPTSGGNTGGWFGYNGVEIEVVPEPSSLALLSMGGLMIARRRRS